MPKISRGTRTVETPPPSIVENHRVRVGRERSARTRKQLLDAVLHMCSGETSRVPAMIDDIVKHAGVSRGTFYTHFDTVEQAIAEAGSMLADDMVDDVRLIMDGLDKALPRTATGIMLFLMRAMFDEEWGGFIARVGVLREENVLSRDIRSDLALGVATGEYSVRNPIVASDLIFGTVVEAILRINQGLRSTSYIIDIAEMVLRALGIEEAEAHDAAQENFARLIQIAPTRLSWWHNFEMGR